MKDKWLNTSFEENTLQPHKEELPDYSDPERIQFMMQLGFSRSDIHDSLTKQLFNNITATYILLGHRRQKTGSLGLPPGAPSIRSLSTDATAAGYLAGLKINGSGNQHRRHSTATTSGSRQSSQPFSSSCHHPTPTSGSGTPTAAAPAGPRTSFRRTTVSPVAATTTAANNSEEESGGKTVVSQNSPLLSPPKTATKTTTGVLRRVSVGSMDSFNKQNPPSGTALSSGPPIVPSSMLNRALETVECQPSAPLAVAEEKQKTVARGDHTESSSTPTGEDKKTNGAIPSSSSSVSVSSSSSEGSTESTEGSSASVSGGRTPTRSSVGASPAAAIANPSTERKFVTTTKVFTSTRSSAASPDTPTASPAFNNLHRNSNNSLSSPQVSGCLVDIKAGQVVGKASASTSPSQQQQRQPDFAIPVLPQSTGAGGKAMDISRLSAEPAISPAPVTLDTYAAAVAAGDVPTSQRPVPASRGFNRNQPGFEYRSLRLPAETAAALTRDAFFANDFTSKSPSPGFVGGGLDASVTAGGVSAATAANNAYSRQGRGFLVPFARNVPERCTIQHVPPRETVDRLALERPEGWSRLVRHPGTAANMDQKTTLADLYGQADPYWRGKAPGTGTALPRSGLTTQPAARSPSEQSVISITSAVTTTSMTAGVLDSEGEHDDAEFVGAEEGEGDSTLGGGLDRRLSNFRSRRRGGTPQSLCETNRPLTKEKSSTLSEPSSSKKFSAPTTSNNANGGGLGFFRNLTMRISRSKIFKLPFGQTGSHRAEKEADTNSTSGYSTLRSLRGVPGSQKLKDQNNGNADTDESGGTLKSKQPRSGGMSRSRSTVSGSFQIPSLSNNKSPGPTEDGNSADAERLSRRSYAVGTNETSHRASSRRRDIVGAMPDRSGRTDSSMPRGYRDVSPIGAEPRPPVRTSSTRKSSKSLTPPQDSVVVPDEAEIVGNRPTAGGRLLFRVESNSRRQLDEMMNEIKHVLTSARVAFTQTEQHKLQCTWHTAPLETDLDSDFTTPDVLRLELEVCKLQKAGMNGVRFKRLSGPVAEFKRVSQKLAEDLKL
ncbi:unnamed protein product [Schistocephalus solidus]|uniref:non-specific serine/threonine protein kinase n=1 Tax=Schistocephalus solidus TaxID=70667 RepID=A0A183T6M8_SCHSO|nr:unnamed protein product [Schistocephalus solidus]